MNCRPGQVNHCNYTALMCAFQYYGQNHNCDSNVLHKLLDMNCIPEQIDMAGITALMYAFEFYGNNPNCDSSVFLKLLNMNCIPKQIDIFDNTALMRAFQYYGSNPNYDPKIFLKLIDLLHPSITRFKLIDLLDTNTDDSILKTKILGEYNYSTRNKLIRNRVFKRRLMGKGDCIHLF
jgi:hypothetical protein